MCWYVIRCLCRLHCEGDVRASAAFSCAYFLWTATLAIWLSRVFALLMLCYFLDSEGVLQKAVGIGVIVRLC